MLIKSITNKQFFPLILALMCSVGQASGVSFAQNQVLISAEQLSDKDSHDIIRCVISNQSSFTLASINLQTKSSEFQFELLDSSGKTILQDAKWSNDYAQKGSPRYEKPRAAIGDYIHPGQKIEFDLDLQAAYGEQLKRGKMLKVSWVNIWEDKEVDVGEWRDSNGIETPRHRETFHFPMPRWELSVSLPLMQKNLNDTNTTDSQQTTETSRVNHRPPGDSAGETRAPESTPPANLPSDLPADTNSWWWTLLALPLALLAWLGLRLRKP